MTATRGIPLGIDFSGGTLVVVEFAQQGVAEDDVRGAVALIPGDEVVQRYGPAADRQFLIRLPLARTAARARVSRPVLDKWRRRCRPLSSHNSGL